MTLRWQQLLCGAILFSAVSSQEQTGAQSPKPDKPSFQVLLTASSEDGSSATPDQADLSVSVDKQPAQINALRSAKNDPLLFAVLIDTSASDATGADLIRKAALRLFQGLSTDTNRGYLVLFSQSVALSKQPLQASQVQSVVDGVKFSGGTAVYDAIQQTCVQRLSRSGNLDTPRRAILLISDGEDNLSHVTSTNAEGAAEKEGIAVFSLAIRSSLAGPRGERFLKEVSHNTGGQAISVKKLTDGVGPLLTAIGDQFDVSFVPAQSLDQTTHLLEVKTSQKHVRIAAPAHISIQ